MPEAQPLEVDPSSYQERGRAVNDDRLALDTLDSALPSADSGRVDQELVAYLDGRFGGLDERLSTRFAAIDMRLDGIDGRLDGIDGRFDGIDARFDGIDARFAGIDPRFDGIDARFERLEVEIRLSREETRRHFDVATEDFRNRLQAVAEGVLVLDERLERFRVEVSDQFATVDRRLLRLEATLIGGGDGGV